MTLEEFFKELKELDLKWYLDEGGAVRAHTEDTNLQLCPVTAVHRKVTGQYIHPVKAWLSNIMVPWDINLVIASADNRKYDLTLRNAMLQACNLPVKG